MKVGILTWYQAINHGAVLQTYASSETLKSMGVQPVVLDYQWSIYDKSDKKTRILRRLKSATLLKLFWYMRVKKLYNKKSKNFQIFISKNLKVGNLYSEEKGMNAVYIGSDMVFDITEGYNSYMHGEGVPAPYIFSYAASFGYSTIERIKDSGHYEEIRKNLNYLGSIGYRDEKTKEICEKMGVTVPMTETIDPVLCYGFEKEIDAWDSGKWKNQNYILIYAYDSTMNDLETIQEIKRLAKREGLKIISCGYYHKWCDECLPASPDEFLEMVKHARYVITDTFHGTVFSLILHKRFVSIIRENGFKVRYLLQCANLDSRIAYGVGDMEKVLAEDIEFASFESWLKNARNASKKFIVDNLNRAKEVSQ